MKEKHEMEEIEQTVEESGDEELIAHKKAVDMSGIWLINESLEMTYGVTAYLLGTQLTRQEKDDIRAQLLETVPYKKLEYKGKDNAGGYRFDHDALWSNYYQKQERLKKILDHRRIRNLDELAAAYFTSGDKKPKRRYKDGFVMERGYCRKEDISEKEVDLAH